MSNTEPDLAALLKHTIFMLNRLHVAMFAIAEAQGTIPADRLQLIYEGAADEGARYVAHLPEHIAKMQTAVAALGNGAKSK